MTTASLHGQLLRIGRRVALISLLTGAIWAVAVALLLAIGGAWLDLVWELPPAGRIAVLAGSAAVAAGVVCAAVWLAARRRQPRELARRLDRAAATGGEILTGVDLLLDKKQSSPLTGGLAALAVERAGQVAERADHRRAAPIRPLGWAAGAFALVAAIVAIAAIVMPRLAQTQWQRFTDPFGDHPPFSRVVFNVEPGDIRVVYGAGFDIRVATEGPPIEKLSLVIEHAHGEDAMPMFPEPGGGWRATVASVTAPSRYHVRAHAGRSPRFHIDVVTVPLVEAVRFRITPPAYTNRPAYDGPLPPGGITGLPGTRVQVWAKSNRPLAAGSMAVPGNSNVAMSATSPGAPEASGEFTIRSAGRLRFTITDVDGQQSTSAFDAPVDVLVDERPFVRLLEPPAQSFATPQIGLPVVVAAEDDYGISRVQIYRSLNDSRAMPLDVPIKSPPPTRWQDRIVLPLSSYGLQPGDEIKLYARVEDSDPHGPKGAESAIVVVKIIAQEEFEKLIRAREGLELLQSKYMAVQRRMAELADQADRLQKSVKEEAQKNSEDADKLGRKGLEEMAENLKKEAERLEKQSKQDLGYDIDKHLSKHLEKLSKQMEQLSRRAQKLAGDKKLSPEDLAKAIEEMKNELDQERQQAENETVKPLEQLAQVQKLLEDSARFTNLAQKQKSLAERLKSLEGKERPDDPSIKARMRDLQEEQQRLHSELNQLLDDIEEHAARLPDQPEDIAQLKAEAQEFVEKVRNAQADEAMADAESGLGEFSGTRGYRGAKKAADILDGFLSKCKGMSGKGKQCLKFQPGLGQGLGDTCEQLLAEAGLIPGQGENQGNGAGSGYSARRNSLDNVGLYGGLPSMNESQAGSGLSNKPRTGRPTPRGVGATPGSPAPGAMPKTANATGPVEALIPPTYKRRVAEYFQRIADEVGGKDR